MAAPVRDWSLRSGERQTSPWFADANAAHRARYEWAADVLGDRRGQRGADVFSATGYGTAHLAARTGTLMRGFEGSVEAVAVAARAHPGIVFTVAEYPCPLPTEAFDFVVSLESLEHVDDDDGFAAALVAMLRPGGDLLLSVPNEDRVTCAAFGNRFHVRHYTPRDLTALFENQPVTCVATYSQHIHRYVETAFGLQRRGRLADDAQTVFADPAWASVPCALLAHYRKEG
jgi:SAM-dependent methyltransferase